MTRRYPLEPLLGLRRERVEKRATEHGGAVRQSERQAGLLRAARSAREDSERALGEERTSERQRVAQGEARAVDLQQGERHRVGAAERLLALKAREAEAAARARAAEVDKERARAQLARARADEKAVVEHAGRFRRAEQRAEEQAADEAAAEHWSVSRRGARRG